MNSKIKDKLLVSGYLALIVLSIAYLSVKPIILIFDLCPSFGEYCKLFTGIFYNSVFYGLIIAGLVYTLVKTLQSGFKKRSILKDFNPYKNDIEKLNKVLIALNIDSPVMVSRSKKPVAFISGLIKHKLYLGLDLVTELNEKELRAVISHEAAHMFHGDALHLTIAGLATNMFFYLPGMRAVLEKWQAQKEFRADESAIKTTGQKDDIVSALLKVAVLGHHKLLVPSFSGTDIIRRINKIDGKEVKQKVSRSAIVVTVFVVLLLGSTALSAGATAFDKGCPMHAPLIKSHFCID